jgi:hypothetical protein
MVCALCSLIHNATSLLRRAAHLHGFALHCVSFTKLPRGGAHQCCCCCCQVRVVRGGCELTLSCFDLLVGDVLLVEAGDILPADGLLYAGGQLK